MAFCENCGKELGPDEVCDCQKTQAAEASNAETETKAQTEAASGAATGVDTTPATSAATAGTDTQQPQGGSASAASTTAASTGSSPYGQAAATDAGDKPAKKTPVALIVGAAAAVVIILGVIIVNLMGSGSYKTPVKELVKLINKQSTDVFAYQALSDPISNDYSKRVYSILKKNDDMKEEFDDMKSDLADFYEDIDGFKITKCDFTAAKELKKKDLRNIEERIGLDKDDLEDLLEEINDMDKGDYEDLADLLEISVSDAKKFTKETKAYFQSLSKIKVTKGYEVTLRLYGKYDGEEDKTDKITVKVIKVNGKWRIYNVRDFYNQLDFDKDLSDVDLSRLSYLTNGLDFSYFY